MGRRFRRRGFEPKEASPESKTQTPLHKLHRGSRTPKTLQVVFAASLACLAGGRAGNNVDARLADSVSPKLSRKEASRSAQIEESLRGHENFKCVHVQMSTPELRSDEAAVFPSADVLDDNLDAAKFGWSATGAPCSPPCASASLCGRAPSRRRSKRSSRKAPNHQIRFDPIFSLHGDPLFAADINECWELPSLKDAGLFDEEVKTCA